MIKAPTLACDSKRTEALRKLQLLDSPIEERFDRITRMGRKILDVPIVAFTLVDETRQTFKSVQGLQAGDVDRSVSICGHAIAGDDIFVVPDTLSDERFYDNPIVTGNPSIGFYAGCPVRSPEGEKIGMLCIMDHTAREITQDQIQGIRDIVATVEAELRSTLMSKAHVQLLQDLNSAERLALIDPLTRIWNRNGIVELIKKEWDNALEQDQSIGIIMADIDHFKKINDTYGHPVGDEVIKHVAETMVTCVGGNGYVGRVGGEEFLIIVSENPNGEPLLSVAERIHSLLASSPVHTKSGHLDITLSFGAVVSHPNPSQSHEEYISSADKALYRAKANGRNRVEVGYL